MKQNEKNISRPIGLTVAVTVSYLLVIYLGFSYACICALYLVTLAMTVWMAIRILKDPYSTEKTFGEHFYQDRDDLRRLPGEG